MVVIAIVRATSMSTDHVNPQTPKLPSCTTLEKKRLELLQNFLVPKPQTVDPNFLSTVLKLEIKVNTSVLRVLWLEKAWVANPCHRKHTETLHPKA